MRSFSELFRGREDAHGYYGSIAGAKPSDRGKRTGKAGSVKDPVTPQLYADHLAGKKRLGIIPVMSNGKVWWFCLDIDFYDDPKLYENVCNAIKDCGLSLVPTLSKSGGVHVWCFLEEPIPAPEAHAIAEAMREKLGLPKEHIDIFPKDFSPTDIGHWVNIPYYGDACFCIGETGLEKLTMDQFLEFANDRITTLADLKFKKREKVKAKRSKAPPCIDYMIENGVEEGKRNHCVFQFGIYAKRAFEDWKQEVEDFNEKHVHPPMRRDEIAVILKSLASKEYDYKCKEMKSIYCDAKTCKTREYGIGAETLDIQLDRIEKIDGEEPLYIVEMMGKKFTCSAKEMFRFPDFQLKAFAATNQMLPGMKSDEWRLVLAPHLEEMVITDPGKDTEMRDRVIAEFQGWCRQSTLTTSIEDALDARVPYFDGKCIYFVGDNFMRLVDRGLKTPRDKVWIYLRNWGVVAVDQGGERLWMLPINGPLWFDPYKDDKA